MLLLPPLAPPLLLQLLILVPVFHWKCLRLRKCQLECDIFDSRPSLFAAGRQTVAHPLLMLSHVIQPGKTLSTGPADELLLHSALVAQMPD